MICPKCKNKINNSKKSQIKSRHMKTVVMISAVFITMLLISIIFLTVKSIQKINPEDTNESKLSNKEALETQYESEMREVVLNEQEVIVDNKKLDLELASDIIGVDSFDQDGYEQLWKEKLENNLVNKMGQDDEYITHYESFISGKINATTYDNIADKTGKNTRNIFWYLERYSDVAYYYIMSEDAKNPALVIFYMDAIGGNDIYYYENGEIVLKDYYGRHATGGESLVNESYLIWSSSDISGEYSITQIAKLDENYNRVDKLCVIHDSPDSRYYHEDAYYQELGYKIIHDNSFMSDEMILKNYYAVNVESDYYDDPEKAIFIKGEPSGIY